MVDYTREMKAYDMVCSKLAAAGIAFKEIEVDNYKITFELSKDGFTSNIIVDCASAYVEGQTEYAIAAFEKLVKMNEGLK